MTAENWKPIKGYGNKYLISSLGTVKSFMCRSIVTLKPGLTKAGYFTVSLRKNKRSRTHYIHRLVAQEFISNPRKKPTVNHKNGDRKNNSVDNLEWATYSENHKHSYNELGRMAYMKGKNGVQNPTSLSVRALNEKEEVVGAYESMRLAAIEFGVSPSAIGRAVKYRYKMRIGLRWEFV